MARHGIDRRSVSGALPGANPPGHDAWNSDLHTGILELELETLAGRFVSPGTGRLSLWPGTDCDTQEAGELAVHSAAKRAGEPVIPGSGIKGAVRTHYEILSDSCDPHAKGKCQRNIKEKHFAAREYCEACSLFGCMGWHGRVSLSDASPAEPGSVHARMHWVPTPWEPDRSKTVGDFRIYDLGEATVEGKVRGSSTPAEKNMAREGYEGRFTTRLNFWNVTEQELGRLLLAMGLAEAKEGRFPIRLGGCKFDGQGAVLVRPVAARFVVPQRREVREDALRESWAGWISAAKAAPWYAQFGPKLEELGEILRPAAGEV